VVARFCTIADAAFVAVVVVVVFLPLLAFASLPPAISEFLQFASGNALGSLNSLKKNQHCLLVDVIGRKFCT